MQSGVLLSKKVAILLYHTEPSANMRLTTGEEEAPYQYHQYSTYSGESMAHNLTPCSVERQACQFKLDLQR
jgi:hypothetical protein